MDYSVRLATVEDASRIRDIYAPFVESTPISFEMGAPSVSEIQSRIETRMSDYPWLVCETTDTVIGYAAAGALRSTPPYRWTVELSVYVAEGHRRSGVGTALYTSLLAVLEEQGYCNAYAVTTLPNSASRRLHERVGFESVGTFPSVGYKQGEWHDVEWWYRQIGLRPADPDPPTPLAGLSERELAAALGAGEGKLEN